MSSRPFFLMTDPAHFDVCYQINPWMHPAAWRRDSAAFWTHAQAASAALRQALRGAGARVETLEGRRGLPDLVFPANGAIVLDGRALMARFRYPERQGEEPVFRAAFCRLKQRGLIREIIDFPEGVFQEGAGDCIWDERRGLLWTAHGPRSSAAADRVIRRVFGRETVPLELASERFYHLDTCFCPLANGELLYYPPAFTAQALAAIHARVPAASRIEATEEDARAFCVNAVRIGRTLIMARASPPLRTRLSGRGYRLVEVDLAPFLLSGGAAYCMTLRLDRTSQAEASLLAAE